MSDLKMLGLMLREEFRMQASFFNRSYFLASSLAIILFAFIMGLNLPMLHRIVAMDDILLVSHWVILLYGLGVGGFAMFGERILERRFGSVSLLLSSGYTLPLRFRRLFLIFCIKDMLYYVFFTIFPMILGLALSSFFVSISLFSIIILFISLTLSFLIGMSLSVLLFTLISRFGSAAILIMLPAAGIYLAKSDIHIMANELPALEFYYSRSLYPFLKVLMISFISGALSLFLVRETPAPNERKAKEAYRKISGIISGISSRYFPLLSKDIIDLARSGILFPVIMTFLMPLAFIYAITWFVESVMLWDFNFSLLFYAVMVGFFCTLLYSWLSNIDISECYNSMPLSMPHVIRAKLMLFLFFTIIVALPYLIAVGYLKVEMELLWIGIFIMFTVSVYVGSVLAYLTGLFTNSYLLDARILFQFSLAVIPPLLGETLASFYFPIDRQATIFYIVFLGCILVLTSVILLRRLDGRWNGKLFRIA